MGITKDLTRDSVLQAIATLDVAKKMRWGKSMKFDLVFENKHYPPKAVLGLATCLQKQVDPYSLSFDGGEPTNSVLRDLGFVIVSKTPHEDKENRHQEGGQQ